MEMTEKGVSLLELLVTIAIVSVLLTLSTPALRTARITARTQECVATVRGIGQASLLWANDHDDYWPHIGQPGRLFNTYYVEEADVWLGWFDQMFQWTIPLYGYIESENMVCPGDSSLVDDESGSESGNRIAHGSYVLSSSLLSGWALWKEDDPASGSDQYRPVRMAEVAHPSDKVMYVEAAPYHLPGFDYANYTVVIEANLFDRLSHGVPLVKCDGSAEAPPMNTLPPVVATPPALQFEEIPFNTILPLMNTRDGFLGRDF